MPIETIEKKHDRIKGHRVRRLPENYVVIDIETTGFDPVRDKILEISAVKVSNGITGDVFSTLVNPGTEIPPHIIKLTGINNDMVSEAPFIEQVITEFVSFIGENIVVGHNVAFDLNFVTEKSFQTSGKWIENDYVDTYYWAMSLDLPVGTYKLSALKTFFGIEQEESHRALADCMTTFALAEKLKTIAKESRKKVSDSASAKKPADHLKVLINDDTSHGEIDMNNMLFGKKCVFTGALERFTRANAKKAVETLGGTCTGTVSNKTDFLILGNNDYNPAVKDGKSTSHRKAEELILAGHDLQILSEDVFCEILKMSNYLLEE